MGMWNGGLEPEDRGNDNSMDSMGGASVETKITNFGQLKPIKSTKSRSKEDVQKEYAELCGIAGDKQYRKIELEAQLQQINEQLFKLNQEHYKLAQQEPVTSQPAQESGPTVEETKTP